MNCLLDGGITVRPWNRAVFSLPALRAPAAVRDSHGTLILTRGEPTGGTATTIKVAATHGKPCLVLDLTDSPYPESVHAWVAANDIP